LRGRRTEASFETAHVRVDNGVVPESVIRRRLVVHGRVQGVFFRDSTRERARSTGVSGWAKNRSDGAVEVVLEGAPDAVDRMTRFVQRGPGSANVDSVDTRDEEPEGLSGFEIR
jgi:acylphosphatase